MKSLFKLSLVSLSLLAVSGAAFADAAPSNAELQAEIQAIMAHDQKLQHEVHMLKAQLQTTKHQQHHAAATHYSATKTAPKAAIVATPTTVAMLSPNTSSTATTSTNTTTVSKQAAAAAHVAQPWTTQFGHALTVTTSPLTGNTMAGDASDILEQMSKMNQQLTLLQQQATFLNYLAAEGTSLTRPVIELSGGLEGQLYYVNGFNISSNPNGINLTTAQLDVNAMVSSWASGFMAIQYNNQPISQGNREPNGSLYIDRGFMTLGNLNQFPVYFSGGEMYVPFGRYSSMMLTDPITQSLGQTRSPAALLGYSQYGIYASLYGYSGEQTSGGDPVIKQGGTDVGYKWLFGTSQSYSFDNGVSVISNIADSQGLQDTGNPNLNEFQGFAQTPGDVTGVAPGAANALIHRVPGIDAHSTLSVGNWTILAEYVGALEPFAEDDLSFSPNPDVALTGAKPQALHTEIDYSWHVFSKPINFGIDYDHSWQGLGAYLPMQSFTGDISSSLIKNTILTFEYRRDDDYSVHAAAAGGVNPAYYPPNTIIPQSDMYGTGGWRNTYLAQLGVYF